MNNQPDRYVLDCETYPRSRDLARFLAEQITDLGGGTRTSELGEVLVGILEDRGLLELDVPKMRLPILSLDGWRPLIAEARTQLAEEDSHEGAGSRLASRVRATPPGE